MCNSIFIDKNTIPKAKDGEEFEVKVKGVYHTDENGTRKLDVLEADGNEVVDPEETDCGCGGDHNVEEDPMDQTSDDALRIFILKKQKK